MKAFFGRLGAQIVISGSAMAAIHLGMGVAPDVASWIGWERPAAAGIASPPLSRPVAVVPPNFAVRFPLPFATGEAPTPQAAHAFPVPKAAPERPVRTASVEGPSLRGVQRFDACRPACPSRDPLVQTTRTPLAATASIASLPVDRGTDYPEVPDDGLQNDSGSLLAVPGRALGATGRTARDAWNMVGSLLPFD